VKVDMPAGQGLHVIWGAASGEMAVTEVYIEVYVELGVWIMVWIATMIRGPGAGDRC